MNPSNPPKSGAGSAPKNSNSASSGVEHLMPTRLSWLYLTLALAGAIWPWLANLAFIQQYGQAFDIGMFVGLANANPASQSLFRDLAIGATAVIVWLISESRRLQMRGLAWVLLSCVTIAFACGAPLFLYLRERRLAELRRQGWILEP